LLAASPITHAQALRRHEPQGRSQGEYRSAKRGGCLMSAEPTTRRWRDAQGEHIDVRGLPPPEPLVAILRLVHEQDLVGGAVIVHHDRDPALLYPELAERGWWAERVEGALGEVRLRLSRST
jgi:hypothetical protein